jgi:hypothetical protein
MMKEPFFPKSGWISADKVIILIAALEFFILFLSGVSFSGLAGANFFDFGVDIFFALVFTTGLPQLISDHLWLGILMDVTVFALMMLLFKNPRNNKIAIALLLLSFVFYITLMGYLTNRNYHAGIFLVWVPFLFRNSVGRSLAYEATRYYLLFFYFSAAVLKFYHQTLSDVDSLSANLVNQFKPYFIEGNTGVRTDLNLYLINHPTLSYILLVGATLVELACILGFFTKKWDKWLAILLLGFHAVNWLIMDIAPIGQLAFICLLFAGKSFLVPVKSSEPLRTS